MDSVRIALRGSVSDGSCLGSFLELTQLNYPKEEIYAVHPPSL